MAESSNEELQTPRQADQANQAAAMEARLGELKATRMAEAETDSGNNKIDSGDQASDLSALKSQAGAQLAKKAATEATKKAAQVVARATMSIAASVASAVGGAIVATFWLWGPILLILFLGTLTYMYWNSHKYSPSLYWNAVTGDYAGLINNAINDTAGAYDTVAPPDTSAPAKNEAANISADQPAE